MQCECDDEDDQSLWYTNFWSLIAVMWLCCWVARCARRVCCTPPGSDQADRERREALLARAVMAAAIAASSSRVHAASTVNSEPDTPVVQAIPVHDSADATPAPLDTAVHATLVTIATVDESVEAPPMAVPVAEPATEAQAGRGAERSLSRCTECGVLLEEPRGNFCRSCGVPFGSE